MNTDMLPAIGLAIGLVIFLAAMGYFSYLAWFHPAEFKERQVNKVKDWWPFANSFRQQYRSNEFLWLARIGPSIFLLIFLVLGILAFLGYLGFFP
jgi:hypothetical protein